MISGKQKMRDENAFKAREKVIQICRWKNMLSSESKISQ